MKAEIVSYLESSRYLQEQLLPFYSSQAGRLVLEKTEKVVRQQLPLYVTELEGLAAGPAWTSTPSCRSTSTFQLGTKVEDVSRQTS